MFYGFANAPAVFQSLINKIFRDPLNQCVIAYTDRAKLSISSTSRQSLSRLHQHQLYMKAEKCEFHTTQTTFLSYNISHQGVKMDMSKIQAVAQASTVKELQRFLGFADSYRMFNRN